MSTKNRPYKNSSQIQVECSGADVSAERFFNKRLKYQFANNVTPNQPTVTAKKQDLVSKLVKPKPLFPEIKQTPNSRSANHSNNTKLRSQDRYPSEIALTSSNKLKEVVSTLHEKKHSISS